MWRIVLLAAMLTMLSVGVTKAAPFPDVPDTHWASSAVQQLKAKGVLEGYPDGLYRGKRAASRYEMAMVASRIVAKLEQLEASLPDFSQFATKEELAAVKRMVDLNSQKIEELGVRVDALEKKIGELDSRLTKLEKVTFYGWYEGAYVNQGIEADQIGNVVVGNTTTVGHSANERINFFEPTLAYSTAKVGWNNSEVKPWSSYVWTKGWNALPISTAVGMNDVGYLNIHGKISDNWHIKATISGENLVAQMGSSNVSFNIGISSLFFVNVGESNWIKPYSKKSQLRYNSVYEQGWLLTTLVRDNGLYFESLKLYNSDRNFVVTLGGFNPNLVDGSVFSGPEVPFLWDGQNFFAADGFHLYHKPANTIFGTNLEYEIYSGTTSKYDFGTSDINFNLPFILENITQRTFGVTARFNFQKGHFRISYNSIEDAQEEFNRLGQNYVMLMATGPYWGLGWSWMIQNDPVLNSPMFGGKYGDSNIGFVMGPQQQSTIGADFRYNINERFSFEGRFATSNYKPVKELGLDTNGSMFSAKLHGTWGNTTESEFEKDGLKAKSGHFSVEYLSVDPDFSPFLGVNGAYYVNANQFFANPQRFGYYDNLYWAQLPYPVYLSALSDVLTYTAHNAKMYPNNREGIRLNVQYKFSDAFLGWASYESLDQKEAARDMDGPGGGTLKWGWYEPIFGTTQGDLGLNAGDVVKKGTIDTFNVGFNYKFQGGKFDFTGQYYNTDVKRTIPTTAANLNDNIDYTVTAYDLLFRYMPNEKWTWHIGYNSVQSDGKFFEQQDTPNYQSENMSWQADALRIGVDWKLNKDVDIFANYRFLNFDTKTFQNNNGVITLDNGDWKGTQMWFGARVKFGQK